MLAAISLIIFGACCKSVQGAVCPDGEITSACECMSEWRTAGICYGGSTYVPPVTCWNVLPYEDCPCTEHNPYHCNLPECTSNMQRGALCEADKPLPSDDYTYGANYNINNCPAYFDVFEYICPLAGDYYDADLAFAMRASDWDPNVVWRDHWAGVQITASQSAQFEPDYVRLGGTGLYAMLPTSPNDMPAVTYVVRFRVQEEPSNKGWIMSQYPDYGWSRALAISDSRLGYIGSTPGNFDSTLGRVTPNKWHILAGTWTQNGSCRTWLDSVPGAERTCSNGDGSSNESLIIGGRQLFDDGHNPGSIDISHALVYRRALDQKDITRVKSALSGVACDPSSKCGEYIENGFTCDWIVQNWECRGSGCCGDDDPTDEDGIEDTCDTSSMCGSYQQAGKSCAWILKDFNCDGTGCCEGARRLEVSPKTPEQRLFDEQEVEGIEAA